VRLAEARQRQVVEQLKEAERERTAAEARLKDAEAKLDEARKTAQSVIDAAGKSAEQLRQELKGKAETRRDVCSNRLARRSRPSD